MLFQHSRAIWKHRKLVTVCGNGLRCAVGKLDVNRAIRQGGLNLLICKFVHSATVWVRCQRRLSLVVGVYADSSVREELWQQHSSQTIRS